MTNKDKGKKSKQKKQKGKQNPPKAAKNESTSPNSTQNPSSHKYTKFNSGVINCHDHFNKYIKEDLNDEFRFICKACQPEVSEPKKTKESQNEKGLYYDNLHSHLQSKKHKTQVGEDAQEIPIALMELVKFRDKKKRTIPSKETLDSMRVEMTAFLLQNQLAFSLAPDLITFIQHIVEVYGADAIHYLTLSDRTAGQIAKNTISKTYKNAIFDDLRNTVFSLSLDESCDKYGPTYLCTHARYIKEGSLVTKLLSINEVKDDSTGHALFNMVTQDIFEGDKERLLGNNFIGICSDRGPNMFSAKDKGVVNRLRDKFPHVIAAQDFSHSYNLVMQKGIGKLPSEPIALIKKISKHFGKSSIRRAKLNIIQNDMGEKGVTKPMKVLSYVETRWTSLLTAIERILLIWPHLEVYTDQEKAIGLSSLMTKENQIYLCLFSCLLQRLNAHIEYFEDNNREYSTILPKVIETLIMTAKFVIAEENLQIPIGKSYLDCLLELPFKDKNKMAHYICDLASFKKQFLLKYSYLELDLKFCSEEFCEKYYSFAKDFFVEVICKMLEYIPFGNSILNSCEVVRAERFDALKWTNLAKQFTNIVGPQQQAAFHNQLDMYEYNFSKFPSLSHESVETVLQFWNSKMNVYPLLSKIALACLTLPYSSVSVERTFSHLRDIKHSKRNRLCADAVEACLLAHHELKDEENFTISKEMLANYKVMWSKKRSTEDQALGRDKEDIIGPSEELDVIEEEVKIEIEDANSNKKGSNKRRSEVQVSDLNEEIENNPIIKRLQISDN